MELVRRGAPLRAALSGVALLGFAATVSAQPAGRPATAPAPAAVVAPAVAPERTSAQFGDWTLTCAQAGAERLCEIMQVFHDQQRQPVAALALGRPGKDQPQRLTFRLPVNVTVGRPVSLLLDTEAGSLPFRACAGSACQADLELRDEALLRRLRARTAEQPGRLEWVDAGGRDQGVAVSLRGFNAAMDALARETR